MPQQFMDHQQEDECYTPYFQQKLHPHSSGFPLKTMVVVGYFILLCLVIVADTLIGTAGWTGWLFLWLLLILVIVGLAMLFKYDWSLREK